MASSLAERLGIKVCIVDDKGTRALNGRSDVFHVQTGEISDSFGLDSLLQQHGTRFDKWCLWVCANPGPRAQMATQKMHM